MTLLDSRQIFDTFPSSSSQSRKARLHSCFSCSQQLSCCLIHSPNLDSVSMFHPSVFSILIFNSLMDLVPAAQLIFPGVCIDASLMSSCSAHVIEILFRCSAFVSRDHKSPDASSQFHSSIPSIRSAKESLNHSSKVRFSPAIKNFLTTSHVVCISLHSTTIPASVLPWAVCTLYLLALLGTGREHLLLIIVPSVLVSLDAHSLYVVQFTLRPLNRCH